MATEPTTTVRNSTWRVSKNGNSQVDSAMATANGLVLQRVTGQGSIQGDTLMQVRLTRRRSDGPAATMLTHRTRLPKAIAHTQYAPAGRSTPVFGVPAQGGAEDESQHDQHDTISIFSRNALFISSRVGSVMVSRMPLTSRMTSARQTQGT